MQLGRGFSAEVQFSKVSSMRDRNRGECPNVEARTDSCLVANAVLDKQAEKPYPRPWAISISLQMVAPSNLVLLASRPDVIWIQP
jgi:hypothetical protein